MSVRQVGEASLDAGINDQVESDLASGESLSLPITFGILLVAFGALIAAGIPVLLAFSSVVDVARSLRTDLVPRARRGHGVKCVLLMGWRSASTTRCST